MVERLVGEVLKRRPLVQANLLRKFTVAVEQTLVVFSRTPCGAIPIDGGMLGDQHPSLHFLGH